VAEGVREVEPSHREGVIVRVRETSISIELENPDRRTLTQRAKQSLALPERGLGGFAVGDIDRHAPVFEPGDLNELGHRPYHEDPFLAVPVANPHLEPGIMGALHERPRDLAAVGRVMEEPRARTFLSGHLLPSPTGDPLGLAVPYANAPLLIG